MRLVEATFDFDGSDGQLSFRAGDVITVTSEGEPGEWWEGALKGETAWFPSSFCSPPYDDEGIGDDDDDWADEIRAVALYSYEASSPDELSFAAGNIISVTAQDQSWWTGSFGGRTGVFPSNFVELIDESTANRPDAKESSGGMGDLKSALADRLAKARGGGAKDAARATDSARAGAGDAIALSGASAAPPPPSSAGALSTAGDATFNISSSHAGNWAAEEEGSHASRWSTRAGDLGTAGYTERPVDGSRHKIGSRPVWTHPAYADLFASPYKEEGTKRPPPLIGLSS